jgi:hypothetical protein
MADTGRGCNVYGYSSNLDAVQGTVFGPVKSKDGNTCGRIFANDKYFATFFPTSNKTQCGDALTVFCHEFGVPATLLYDGSKEQTGKDTEFQKTI